MLNDIREPKAGPLFMSHENFGFCFVFLRYVGSAFMWLITETFYYLIYIRKLQCNTKNSEYQLLFCISSGDELVDFSFHMSFDYILKFGSKYERMATNIVADGVVKRYAITVSLITHY